MIRSSDCAELRMIERPPALRRVDPDARAIDQPTAVHRVRIGGSSLREGGFRFAAAWPRPIWQFTAAVLDAITAGRRVATSAIDWRQTAWSPADRSRAPTSSPRRNNGTAIGVRAPPIDHATAPAPGRPAVAEVLDMHRRPLAPSASGRCGRRHPWGHSAKALAIGPGAVIRSRPPPRRRRWPPSSDSTVAFSSIASSTGCRSSEAPATIRNTSAVAV